MSYTSLPGSSSKASRAPAYNAPSAPHQVRENGAKYAQTTTKPSLNSDTVQEKPDNPLSSTRQVSNSSAMPPQRQAIHANVDASPQSGESPYRAPIPYTSNIPKATTDAHSTSPSSPQLGTSTCTPQIDATLQSDHINEDLEVFTTANNSTSENIGSHPNAQVHTATDPKKEIPPKQDEPEKKKSSDRVGELKDETASISETIESRKNTSSWFSRFRKQKQTTRQPTLDSKITVQERNKEDLRMEDMVVAIMGPTGSGKSSFVSTLSGYQCGVGHGLESCTTEITAIEISGFTTNSKLVLVDTPGFDDTNKSDKEILDMLADWLQKTYRKHIKLAGIIYLHRITDNRMAGTPLKNLRMFEKLCGKHALKNVVLATTMWDDVEGSVGTLREKELKRKYWKVMLNQGSTTFRHTGTQDSAWAIVAHFLKGSPLLAVRLQKELVDLKRLLPETEAGQELYGRLYELLRKQQETLSNIQKEMQYHTDSTVLNLLKAELQEQKKQVDSTLEDMEKLKIHTFSLRLIRILTSALHI